MKKIITLLSFLALAVSGYSQTKLWGTASEGGLYNAGVIFSTDPSGSNYTVEHHFVKQDGSDSKTSNLTEISGKLYGVLSEGGNFTKGLLFEFDLTTSAFTIKHHFDQLSGYPGGGSLLLGQDGKLYGLGRGGINNQGVIYCYDPATNLYTKKTDLSSLTGTYPGGSLIQLSSGLMYGLTLMGGTNNLGTLFQYDPTANTITKKADYTSVATWVRPNSELTLALNGKIYGTTPGGGTNGMGTIFEFNPATDFFTKRFDFSTSINGVNPMGSLIEAANGKLYGAAAGGTNFNSGVLFEFDPVSFTYQKKYDLALVDGRLPTGIFLNGLGGLLYGLTNSGGTKNGGSLFSFDPVTGTFVKKINLGGSQTIGARPNGGLIIASDGNYYGMTIAGGSGGKGTLFKYDPVTALAIPKYHFNEALNGKTPVEQLVIAPNGKLYGGTSQGGAFNRGVLFEFDPVTHIYIKKLDFDTINGLSYGVSMMRSVNGKLYGTCEYCGTNGGGILFQYDPATNIYIKKIDFGITSIGHFPTGTLIEASDGNLYGCLHGFLGGAAGAQPGDGDGMVYQYNKTNNTVTPKIDFLNQNEGRPLSSLVQTADGKIYGTTTDNYFDVNAGSVFQFDPVLNNHIFTANFLSSSWGGRPTALINGNNGKLYGIAKTTPSNYTSVLFEYDLISNSILNKVNVSQNLGFLETFNSISLAADGIVYGVTIYGGSKDSGSVFRFNPSTGIVTTIINCDKAKGYRPLGALLDPDMITGVKKINNLNSLVVYPNPNNGSFTINLESIKTKGPVTVTICNVLGQEMVTKSGNIYNNLIEVKEAELQPGVYFVKLRQENTFIGQGKFAVE